MLFRSEERFAFQIAKAIVAKREEGLSPKTTLQLASLVASVVRTRELGKIRLQELFKHCGFLLIASLKIWN